jgi:hypothetical protein
MAACVFVGIDVSKTQLDVGLRPLIFGARLVAFDGRQGHRRLEARSVIPSRSFHRLATLVRHPSMALVKPGYHLPYCPNFRSPL